MFILLQAVTSTDIAQRAFDISPTSVYGFLLGGMALIIMAQWAVMIYMGRKILSLSEDIIKVATSTDANLENIERRLDGVADKKKDRT